MRFLRSTLGSVLLVLGFGGVALAAGVWLRGHTQPTAPPAPKVLELHGGVPAESVTVAETPADPARRPEYAFTDLDGTPRRLSDFDGQIVIVNFWATWCPPCLHEIPGFIELQAKYAEKGVRFVGIALDDTDNVKRFAGEVSLNYPTAHGQESALDLMKAFGNKRGGLPYTVLVNREGVMTYRKAGELTLEDAEALILSHL